MLKPEITGLVDINSIITEVLTTNQLFLMPYLPCRFIVFFTQWGDKVLLTSKLAQQVVDSVMTIVEENVNIMDHSGIIIASGQSHRLNSFHKGAKVAIERGLTVEIYPDDLEQYPGTLPGLNMPIELNSQIVGVVGISGHPDTVRVAAKVVTMVTELILEREFMSEEFRSHLLLQEYFATLLLSPQAITQVEKLFSTAKLLNFDLYLPRFVTIINIEPLLQQATREYGMSELILARTKESVVDIVKKSTLVNVQDFIVFFEDRLVILKHLCGRTENEYFAWGVELRKTLLDALQDLPIGLGSIVDTYENIFYSYQEALFALNSTNGQNIVPTIHDFDILASFIIRTSSLTETCQAFQQIKSKIKYQLGKKYDMKNTVTTLLNNNMNITATAKQLYIHRNTLLFRLDKLKETTGLDPCHYLNHAILCKALFET